jgi:hypothetical protein
MLLVVTVFLGTAIIVQSKGNWISTALAVGAILCAALHLFPRL